MLLRVLVGSLLLLSLLSSSARAQLLDISSAIEYYSASNPRVSPGRYGGELRRSPVNYTALWTLNVIADPAGAATFVGNIYPRFVTFEPSRYEPFCVVCTSYSVSADGTEVSIKIREGIAWSDGVPITSHDVVATSRIFRDREILSNYRQFFDDGSSSLNFKAIDDKTVLLTLSRPLPEQTWMSRLSWPVLPNHVFGTAYESGGVEAVEALYPLGTEDFVSAGPWKFGSYSEDGTLVLEQNRDMNWVTDGYGNRLPYVDRLIFSPPKTSEAAALAQGTSDFAGLVGTRDELELLKKAGKVVREIESGQNRAGFIIPNFTHPDPMISELMRNGAFRIALSMLVDREAYQREEFGELAQVAYNYNLLPGYRDLPYPRHSYNPEAARDLLEDLGLRRDRSRNACPDGCFVRANGEPLVLRLSHFDRSDLNPYGPGLARLLREEGLEVVDDPLQRQDYIDRVFLRDAPTFRDFDLLFSIVGTSIEGQEFLQSQFDLGGDFRYWGIGSRSGEPPEHVQPWEERLSEIASAILSDMPDALRIAAIAEGTELFAEHLPMIPLVELKTLQAYDPRLGNTADQVIDEYSFMFLPSIEPLIYIR
jgi:peptide/nickel transport system substrate-binding protein